jgi:hypothetical protein
MSDNNIEINLETSGKNIVSHEQVFNVIFYTFSFSLLLVSVFYIYPPNNTYYNLLLYLVEMCLYLNFSLLFDKIKDNKSKEQDFEVIIGYMAVSIALLMTTMANHKLYTMMIIIFFALESYILLINER